MGSQPRRGQTQRHGGDIYRNRVRLDFSVSIDPLPLPDTLREAGRASMDHIERYPDWYAEALTREIALLERVGPEQVLVGNGASELLMAIAHAFRPQTALLAAPCYSGYAHVLEAGSGLDGSLGAETGRIRIHRLREEDDFALKPDVLQEITEEVDLVFLADPNNPTGRRIEPSLRAEIAGRCREKGIALVLDECFAPLAGSDAAIDPSDGAIRVRAFTKTLAIPGIRLGYLIAEADRVGQIRRQLPEWNVSVPAQEIGIRAARLLRETDHLARAVSLISKERAWLTEELKRLGLRVCASDANFLLVGHAEGLCEALRARGILVRDCGNFEGLDAQWIRIAVRDRTDNQELIAAIREIRMRCRQNGMTGKEESYGETGEPQAR